MSTTVAAPEGGPAVVSRRGWLSRRGVQAQWALVVAFTLLVAAVRAASPEERDPYWGARAGMENMAGLPLARPDTWSWSQPGVVWYQNSPAWNNVLGVAWQLAGFWGLFWVTFVSLVALFAVAWVLAVQLGARPLPGLAGTLIAAIAAFPMLSARATTVVQTMLLLAVWFGFAAGPRIASWRPVVAGGAVGVAGFVLSSVGNQIHLSFTVMAAAVALMWAIQWATLRGTSWLWRGTVTVIGAAGLFAGVLTTPYGLAETLRQSARTKDICQGLIGEWAAIWQVHPIWIPRAAAAIALALFACRWLWRRFRTRQTGGAFRIVAPITAVAAPLAVAGVAMIRFLGVSLLLLLPLFAAAATLVADAAQLKARTATGGFWATSRASEYTGSTLWTRVLSLALVPLVVFGGAVTAKGARPGEQDIIEKLPENCRLYSPDPAIGSATILTRPDVKVWMDGRADFYGREQLVDNYSIIAGVQPIPTGATCSITRIGDTYFPGADRRLDTDPSWRREAEANGYVLWLKNPA